MSISNLVKVFRDTAIKCRVGFKHKGPWEECEWIECEDRRKIVSELHAEPVTTTAAARSAAREWMNTYHAAFKTNKEREDALVEIILRHFPAAGVEGGGAGEPQ